MSVAYIALGSNLGDRLQYLTEAVRRLCAAPHTRLLRASSVYETAPQGKTDQPAFLNMVVEVWTELNPTDLLAHTQAVERSLGRVRLERWGPRTIDLDLLLYDRVRLREPDLELPHPRMRERSFVLTPLLELTPELALPGEEGRPLREALVQVADQEVARFLDPASFLRLVRGVQ